ncbi:MAG: hypothetical protein LBE50_06410, partial [Gallionellaceae bacterium]|nr:hypothetical protein [Gallionellaceae bacterium]
MKTSRKALLPSAIAAVLASPFVMLSGMNPAHAQTIIDGGATETVIGDGSGTQPSPWNPGTDILVGNAGVGVLNISGGGIVVNNFIGTIGNLAGSSGTVNVNGAGSAWTNANALAVGGSGTGVLHIENGGSVSSVIGAIGDDTFSSGAVTVDGAGSHWTNTDSLTVGNGGAGTLEVSNGGAVSSAFAYIGLGSSSTSAATIDGAGSTWTNSDDLYVGVFGTGALAVENGGSVSAGTIFLGGVLSGGTGGDGTLNISDGGAVSSTLGSIGFGADSNGAATIDGAGSTWTNTGDFYVGFGGNATLNITNGG